MKLKVCGLKDVNNIKMVEVLQPDLMGFIFYEKSPRNIVLSKELEDLILNLKVKKVGVFVNEELSRVIKIFDDLQLDFVQLHGDESQEYIDLLRPHVKVIKAFSIDDTFDFNLNDFGVDYFLFDTKGDRRGGNGIKFNWKLLSNYKGETPFILSGGIRMSDINRINKINHPQFVGVDINSGFEQSPGIKNVNLIADFIMELDGIYS